MTLRDQIGSLKTLFFQQVAILMQKMATPFGFPKNPGMPVYPDIEYEWIFPTLADRLPLRKVFFPPQSYPSNYVEVLLGEIPKVEKIPRAFYESKSEGFYNFYVENFKNIVFLPNSVSEFFQIHFNCCLDITYLEVSREMLFLAICLYYNLVVLRILLGWFISINPYTLPFSYFIAFVDWIEEYTYGLLPVVAGVSTAVPVLMAVVGKIGDTLNHLVFTMPFLPSEGVPAFANVDGELKRVLAFRYLPVLWYKYPIPDEIREYWSTERLDILIYMQKSYGNLDIQFLPNRLLDINPVLPSLFDTIFEKSKEFLSYISG